MKLDTSLADRVGFYNSTFSKYPCMTYDKGWMMGVWSCGNNYKGSNYYGSYPNGFLKKIRVMFPEFELEDTLHLFSGSLGMQDAVAFPGVCFDINPKVYPHVVGDATNLSSYFEPEKFSLILADPPYSAEDAKKYGTSMPNRFKVVKEAYKVLKPGGFLIWMDERLPMYRKAELKRVGEILISRSTNHRVRAVFIFQKV